MRHLICSIMLVIVVVGQVHAASFSGGGGGVTGWPQTRVDEITWADAIANAVCIGSGTNPICIYEDATLGGIIRPQTLGNTNTYIWPNFNWRLYDVEGDSTIFVVDPDAVDNLKYTWSPGYRPVKTLPLPADSLYARGSAVVVTDTALRAGGLISPYVTITDSDSDGFYRYFRMFDNWDGSPVGMTLSVVNTNGVPANALLAHVSMECYAKGAAIPTTIATTNEQPITVSFGSSGSCGASACSQNSEVSVSAATAVTVSGTPAGGNWCGVQAQVDAAGTTETVAGLKITQLDIHYRISRGF